MAYYDNVSIADDFFYHQSVTVSVRIFCCLNHCKNKKSIRSIVYNYGGEKAACQLKCDAKNKGDYYSVWKHEEKLCRCFAHGI